MRPEKLFLMDIVEAADYIAQFIAEVDYHDFLTDELRKSAVLKKVEVIGEAIKNIPKDFLPHHSEIDWSGFARMRDRTVHGYFGVNYSIVWETVTQEIPLLREQVAEILAQEFE